MSRTKAAEALTIATCQFPVSADIRKNGKYIQDQIAQAAEEQADIVHFCESALSGYAGSCPEYGVPVFDVASFEGFDWDTLREETRTIQELARQHGIRVILGSAHYVDDAVKPMNCLYVISRQGRIVNRYDKRMCTPGDLLAYTPGNRSVTFTVKGVKCGVLICADLDNANFYHAYRRTGVKVLLHSYYNARFNGPVSNDEWVVPRNQARARDYGMKVFANNSSARHSCWPTFIAGPKGEFHSLRRHASAMLIQTLSTSEFDQAPSLHTGTTVDHPRIANGRSTP